MRGGGLQNYREEGKKYKKDPEGDLSAGAGHPTCKEKRGQTKMVAPPDLFYFSFPSSTRLSVWKDSRESKKPFLYPASHIQITYLLAELSTTEMLNKKHPTLLMSHPFSLIAFSLAEDNLVQCW